MLLTLAGGYGFLADAQVGSAGFRIDMGIRHPDKPGSYILAVECDGATYHSALWARERYCLRQDVLEHRVGGFIEFGVPTGSIIATLK